VYHKLLKPRQSFRITLYMIPRIKTQSEGNTANWEERNFQEPHKRKNEFRNLPFPRPYSSECSATICFVTILFQLCCRLMRLFSFPFQLSFRMQWKEGLRSAEGVGWTQNTTATLTLICRSQTGAILDTSNEDGLEMNAHIIKHTSRTLRQNYTR
jgi:hypothetical protein